ncbi:MAG: sodium/proline symporter PutP [Gammaproteobacteria bacterium]|nr:MAG: sodium/proline symporter PutP [Gammaproteobacteria bacterium]
MFLHQDIIVITFLLYVLLMFVIGWVAWRNTRSLSDYILGGRRIGPWVAALSAGASDMSGWLLLGLPGYAYVAGMESLWLIFGLLVGTWCNWRFIARRLRIYTEQANNALTLPAFLRARFNDQGYLLQITSAIFILLFFMFYTSSGLVAGGKLFETVFELPYHWAVTLGVLVIVVYTFSGGFLAVAWTDLVQGLLMFAALLIVPVVALQANGGIDATMTAIVQNNPYLLSLFRDIHGETLGVLSIISLLAWGLGYFGQPHILARFKAIKHADDLSLARRIAVGWSALCMLGAFAVGMAGMVYAQPVLQGADSEKIFMVLVSSLFHPVIAGILLAAILAAIMSTADSQLLVSSSALAEDFYKALLRPQASDRELVLVGRGAVVLVAAIAYVIALTPDSKVLDLVAYAWAGFGAAFGPTLILSLYWKRMHRNGALAGIITGGGTVVIWKQLQGGWFDLYEIVPGFILAILAIIIVSKLSAAPDEAIQQKYEQVKALL